MGKLDGRIAIVTGGSQGIGHAIVDRLVSDGATVYSLSTNLEKNQKSMQQYVDARKKVYAIRCDVKSVSSCEAAVAQVFDAEGRIDILVNNAAQTGPVTQTHEITEEQFDEVYDSCVKGLFFMTKFCVLHMKEQKSGSIVNIGSIYGLTTASMKSPYHSAKAAVHMQTMQDAACYGHDSIRVNCVIPGGIMTEKMVQAIPYMSPDGTEEGWRQMNLKTTPLVSKNGEPWGYPVDIANAVSFLASHEASYITGAQLSVDGGARLKM